MYVWLMGMSSVHASLALLAVLATDEEMCQTELNVMLSCAMQGAPVVALLDVLELGLMPKCGGEPSLESLAGAFELAAEQRG